METQPTQLLKNTVKEALENILNEQDNIVIDDEIFEYAKLVPSYTGLKTTIYVDDGKTYIRNQHPLVILFRNGYLETDELLPVLISKTPKPLFSTNKLNISESDFYEILSFVSQNSQLLKDFADEIISHSDFYNTIKKKADTKSTKFLVAEMSTLRKEDSHLPTTLWIDEGSNPKHDPRVKFKASNEQRNTREFSSMSISQTPQIFNLPKECELSTNEIKIIEEFVRVNQNSLIQVAKGLISYEDFLNCMITPN